MRSAAAAALTGVVALAGAAGALADGHRAHAAKVRTVRVRLGDHLVVAGSPLQCIVQRSSGTVNLTCAYGTLSSPVLHSYAVAIADRGADIAQLTRGGASAKLITIVQEPRLSGAPFTSPTRAPRVLTVAPTTAVLVGGTHIFCAVQRTGGTVNVTCGLSTLARRLQFPTGSYTVSESAKFALLGKVAPHNGFKTVSARQQP